VAREEIDSRLVTTLMEAQLGAKGWRSRPFGAGKFSHTYIVNGTEGDFVLRVAPPDSMLQLFYEYRMMRQEPGIHARLLAEASVPVPPILAYDFTRSRIDRDYLIMPLFPGEPLSRSVLDRKAEERALGEWGSYIARVHRLTDAQNRFGYLGEHRCMEPQASWPEAFAVMYRKELEDIVACGVYDEATADGAFALLEKHLGRFDSCKTSRLLHGDIWVTNLLVKPDGEVTGVLDFDRACWGDVEWDFAIAEYCGARNAFWDGYGRSPEIYSGDAAIRRLFYLLYEHQKYIVISMSERRNDPAGARRYAAECLSIMENFRRTGRPEF
jgi:aminoglycoside phosphotransferase (APT) family kinase protein